MISSPMKSFLPNYTISNRASAEEVSALYDQYGGALYGALLRLTTDKDQAAAVLQKAFLEIAKQWSGFSGTKEGYFIPMLRQVLQTAAEDLGLTKNEVLRKLHI
ncbi:MAG: hypothetical protein JWP88_829 [Flaviaesturariibacter sp.]|nr:hypothetical protein [Flaviaesturariibacter sp.]